MREIWTLTGYEYKKMFQRKSVWISLISVVILVLLTGAALLLGNVYVEGKVVSSHGEMMRESRQAVNELGERNIDGPLLAEAEKAYGNITGDEFCMDTKEGWEIYKDSTYPYSDIQYMGILLDPSYGSGQESIAEKQFYQLREEQMKKNYEAKKLSEGEIEKHLSEMDELETPLPYGWTEGYSRFNQLVGFNGIFLGFAISICLAPLFAGEYTSRVDQLILTSKFGKSKVISAKLIMGFSFALISAIAINLILLLEIGMIYGLESWNLPVQSSYNAFLLSLPMNFLEMTAIVVMYQVAAICMVAAVMIFCSQRMRSPFGVIIVATLLLFVPLLLGGVSPSNRLLYMLVHFLPTGINEGWGIFDDCLIPVGSGYYYIYQVVPVIYLVLSAVSVILVYRGFRKRQIGK